MPIRREQRHGQRDADFDTPVGRTRPTGFVVEIVMAHFRALSHGSLVGLGEEAGRLHQLFVPLLGVRDPLAYSSPVMKVWLKAPSLISFFHSGVSRTFLNRST